MAAQFAAFALAYLLSIGFTDQLTFNITTIDRLVTYHPSTDFTEVIPGALYNGTIEVDWAVPDSALSGIGTDTLAVKVTATAPENSSVFFPMEGSQAKETSVYLECRIANGTCANGSVLSADIPIAASAKPDSETEASISMRSETVQSVPTTYSAALTDAGSMFNSLKNVFSQNSTPNASGLRQATPAELLSLGDLNFTLGAQANSTQNGTGNFLDSLKPEGDSSDPLAFLRENPLVSILALIIVIVITGAYLLNSKD